MSSKSVNSEYKMSFSVEQFIEFGTFLTKEKRKQLVDHIKKKIRNAEITSQELSDLTPYIKQVDNIFSQSKIRENLADHPEIERQVTSEILQLFLKTRKDFNSQNPYQIEKEQLFYWKGKSCEEILDNVSSLLAEIKKVYNEKEFELSFYKKTAVENYSTLKKDKHKRDALIEAVLNGWERRILEKELKFELGIIEKARSEYCKQLYEKIDKFLYLRELLLPFTNELGRLWDLSAGAWRKTDLNVLTKYAQFLEREQSIKKLAEMLGRMKKEERELEEQERNVTVLKNEWQAEHASKAELVGICESDDLNNLVPSEIALLSDQTLQTNFFKKFSEKKLMTFEYEAKILAKKEELAKQKQFVSKIKEKGPVIICIDTSGSMHGDPETIAKAVAFAILRVALRDSRRCYLISFSTQIDTLELNDLRNSLESIIDFLTMSFHGGTDLEPAFKEALKQIKNKKYEDSDILVISDFIVKELPKEILKEVEEAKLLKNRFYSLSISPNSNMKALSFFDNNWIYEIGASNRLRELVLSVRKVTGSD